MNPLKLPHDSQKWATKVGANWQLSPFAPAGAIVGAIVEIIVGAMKLERAPDDRTDIPIYFRYMNLLLRASEDPEVGMGDFASGVHVGPGVCLPRTPALCPIHQTIWKNRVGTKQSGVKKYSSLEERADKVMEVMVDQATRGQVLQLSKEEARKRFPNLTVASLGAQRKEKLGGVITARVLFDGTHGIAVNHLTRI